MKTLKFVYIFLVVLISIYSCSTETAPIVNEVTPINDTIYKDSILLHSYDYRNLSFYSPYSLEHLDSIRKKYFYYTSFYDTINKINYLARITLSYDIKESVSLKLSLFSNNAEYKKITNSWIKTIGNTKITFRKDSVEVINSDTIVNFVGGNDFTADGLSYFVDNVLYIVNYNSDTMGKMIINSIGGKDYFSTTIEMNNGFKFNTIFFTKNSISDIFGKKPYISTTYEDVWLSNNFLIGNVINGSLTGETNLTDYLEYLP